MGIYDNLVFADVPEALEDVPFNLLQKETDGDGTRYRLWQTKGLNPSMDCYVLREKNGALVLARRHPPLVRWTDRNEGKMDDYTDLIDGADHWRQVRYTGTLSATATLGRLRVVVEITFDSGIATQFRLAQPTVLEAVSPVNAVLLTSSVDLTQPCVWDDSKEAEAVLRFINPSNEHQQVLMRLASIDAFRAAIDTVDSSTSSSRQLAPSGRVQLTTAEDSYACSFCGGAISVGDTFVRLSHDPMAPAKLVIGLHPSCLDDLSSNLNDIWNEYTPRLLTDSL